MERRCNVVITGGGYVGLSLACMLADKNNVVLLDISRAVVDKVNQGIPPIADEGIAEWFEADGGRSLKATTNSEEAYLNADLVFIAVPTDLDKSSDALDMTAAEETIKDALRYSGKSSEGKGPVIVIRSTVPVGFTEAMRRETGYRRILFSPEFLREGSALKDNLSPSRIIIGADMNDPDNVRDAEWLVGLLQESVEDSDCPIQITGSSEAEAVKLFSNTYLAMRIAFFNELDMFAESEGLQSGDIIRGMGMDPRIGDTYNNPGFGYGGYCLPKDTRQMLSNFEDITQRLITAIVESNTVRMEFIADQILHRAEQLEKDGVPREDIIIGVYRINMKKDSDNYRQSASLEVLKRIAGKGYRIEVYEPLISEDALEGELSEVVKQNDLARLKKDCQIIIANRFDPCLEDVREKVYTRDLFHKS